jgi:hypothetical protein
VQVLVFGYAYARIADAACSATTLRRRQDEWIAAGIMEALQSLVLAAHDRMIGLVLEDESVDRYITKTRCDGEMTCRSPVDRDKPGRKRSVVVDGAGIPPVTITAPAMMRRFWNQ